MIRLGGLITLKPITEADVFTATSKETGNVSVFKSKAARDAAIKAGTHEKRKSDKDGAVKDPTDKPKVNIFKRDSDKDSKERLKKMKAQQKSSGLSSVEKEDLEQRLNDLAPGYQDELLDIIKDYEGKLSPEQLDVLKQVHSEMEESEHLKYDDEAAADEMFDDAYYKAKEILDDISDEPKSSTPKKSAELSSDEKEDLENRANDIGSHDDIRTIIYDYKDKLSPEQLEVLKQAYEEMEEADHLKYDDESLANIKFDDAFYKVQDLIQSLDENETTSTRLRDLLPEEETFTAVNKKSGKTSVFKSKGSRDAAIKKGTHSKTKEKGDSKKDGKGGVNIFNKDAGTQKSLFPDIKPDEKPSDDSDKIKDPQGAAKVFPPEVGTDPAKMMNQLYKWQDGPDETGQHWEVDLSKLTPEEADKFEELDDAVDEAVSTINDDDATPQEKKEAKARLKQIEKDGKYVELVYKGLEKLQNKPKGPEAKDYWNSDNKPAPKVGKFKAKPTEDAVKGLDLLSDMSIGGVPKLTPEDMGDKEYERQMLRMIFNSLEDANFHTHNRFIFADLEGKPEKRNTPDYSNAPDDFSAEKSAEFDKWSEENTIFTKDFSSQFNRENERDDVLRRGAIDISKNSEWGGNEILAAYLQKLRKDGKDDLAARIQKSFEDAEKSMNEGRLTLGKLLPEPIINEGTRSQVGIIDRSGKIASAYVHYDGYPSNMKPGLKKHMKNEKDVLNLIKQGGARGIYNDKDIEYYKSGKPTKGNLKDFEKYVDAADRNGMAEYVYLYNMKDKKWYFADVYGDKKLKKLF